MNQEQKIFEMQAQLCQSLSHFVRLRIIHTLKEGPRSVKEIASIVENSQPTVSRHLSILRQSGVVSANRRGAEVYYEIANPKVVEVCEMMRSILAEREALQFDIISSIKKEMIES